MRRYRRGDNETVRKPRGEWGPSGDTLGWEVFQAIPLHAYTPNTGQVVDVYVAPGDEMPPSGLIAYAVDEGLFAVRFFGNVPDEIQRLLWHDHESHSSRWEVQSFTGRESFRLVAQVRMAHVKMMRDMPRKWLSSAGFPWWVSVDQS